MFFTDRRQGYKTTLRDVDHDPKIRFVEGNILGEALVADLFNRGAYSQQLHAP